MTYIKIRRILKALSLGTCKKNILIYSQTKFQLYQSHSLTATGLKSGKKSINWVCGHLRDLKVNLKLKLQTTNFPQRLHIDIIIV